MRPSTVTSILALLLAAACRDAPVSGPASPGAETKLTSAPIVTTPSPSRRPGGCGALVDVEAADLLRLAPDNPSRVLYANAQVGLVVVDVAEPDEPFVAAISRFHGSPAGVFARERTAVVVYEPWDRPPETVVRAVKTAGPDAGRTLGEVVLPGAPRDVWRLGDAIVVARDDGDRTAIATVALTGDALVKRDEIRLRGSGAIVGASPWGAAVARPAEPGLGTDRTAVTWIGVDEARATIDVHGTAVVEGVVPRWRRASDHVIDVAEDARVRLLACESAACPQGAAATYSAIDFAEPERPRVAAWRTIARANDVVAFAGDRLVVSRAPAGRDDATEIMVLRADDGIDPIGSVRVRGTVGSLAIHGDDAIALGWTGSATAGKRAIVHQVRVTATPRLVGSAAFGGEWTWSPAYDDDRALTFDPRSTLAALPMTTVRGKSGPIAAAQVLAVGPRGPSAVVEKEVGAVDRLLFVGGRLLAFSVDGVVAIDASGPDRRTPRQWDSLAPVR